MTTKLSESLRELRDQHAPKDDGLTSLHDDLEKCIAQAEAMEALPTDAEMDRALETMPDHNKRLAQAGELSDEEMQHRALRWSCDHDQSAFTYSQSLAAFGKHLRDHGYLRPSQAIGEQTPVAKGEMWHPDPWLIGNVEAWKKEPPTQVGEDDDKRMKQARAELAQVMAANGWDIYGGSDYPWVVAMNYAWQEGWLDAFTRSPMSSEARDKAISVLEKRKLALDAALKYVAPFNIHKANEDEFLIVCEALSALRGE